MTITRETEIYDNSMLSSYKTCPRQYYLRYGRHWRSEGTAAPLVFGLSWHAGMDVVWQFGKKVGDQRELARLAMAKFLETWEEEGFPPEPDLQQIEKLAPRTPGTAHEMYENYIEQRWGMIQAAELIAVEQPFAVPMPGHENTYYVGRLDKVVEHNGQKLVLEHKTTTEYKIDGGFRASYVESWYTDSQVKGYQFGGGLWYPGLSQVWVDAALVHKKMHHFFRFIPVAHQSNIIEEWIKDTQNWVERVKRDWERGYFPRNEGSCVGKYGPCTFLEICRSTPDNALPNEAPAGYQYEKWEPFDVLKLEKLANGGE